MELWAAFLLGLVGSVHCAGMCGPLALAVPSTGNNRTGFALSRAGYNLGRITAYAIIGFFFGAIGRTVALAGFQRWASLLTGAVILLAVLPTAKLGFRWPAAPAVSYFKSLFSKLLRQRSFSSIYLLGFLNGFLPCGLVYVAGASAVALGSMPGAVGYMVAFGFGTVPMMLGIGLLGRGVQISVRTRLQKLVPVCVVVVGLLLMLRGMSLGIPYVSPNLSTPSAAKACH